MKTIKRLVVARGEGRDMNRQSKEDLSDSENNLYDNGFDPWLGN